MSTEYLKTVSRAQLLELNLPPTKFIVKGLIPQDFHILAGQPKIGKSWLLLHLCLQVSKDEDFWNYETSKGTVLYLCLEDSYNIIQTRLSEPTEGSYFYAVNYHRQQRDKRKTPRRTKSLKELSQFYCLALNE